MNSAYSCPEGTFNSFLKAELASYVEYKVNIGKCSPGSYIPKLRQFDRYCAGLPDPPPVPGRDVVMGFLSPRAGEKSTNVYCRTIMLCGFLDYMSNVLGRDSVYKPGKKAGKGNYVPYVFDRDEIRRIFEAAIKYRDNAWTANSFGLPLCMPCIIAMLYCTGMRISEVLDLRVGDVDLEGRTIQINHAKNDSHRIVTISETLLENIRQYRESHIRPLGRQIYFFDSGSGLHRGHVSIKTAYSYFRRYLKMAGIPHKGRGYGPRLHDIRVTFAVHSLQKLSLLPEDTNALLPVLSAYMGHKSIRCTQQYLWLTKELGGDVAAQMEKYVRLKKQMEGGASE